MNLFVIVRVLAFGEAGVAVEVWEPGVCSVSICLS